MRKIVVVLSVLMVLLVGTLPAYAQEPGGLPVSIQKVDSETGEPLEGATITLNEAPVLFGITLPTARITTQQNFKQTVEYPNGEFYYKVTPIINMVGAPRFWLALLQTTGTMCIILFALRKRTERVLEGPGSSFSEEPKQTTDLNGRDYNWIYDEERFAPPWERE